MRVLGTDDRNSGDGGDAGSEVVKVVYLPLKESGELGVDFVLCGVFQVRL